ncbi:MAG: precorrin-3B synthase [Devosia sp.]
MSLALPIADPALRRRGACPTLEVPMQTGDGLLARLRVRDGRLSPAKLGDIAGLAAQHGNGLVEITARGNLQVRGLTAATTPAFAQAVRNSVEIDDGLVVETPPLAGDDRDEIADPRDLAAAIATLAVPLGARLGPKVTVVVDGLGQITRNALKADIRLTAITPDRWALAIVDATQAEVDTANAPAAVMAILQRLAALGPTARSTDLVTAGKSNPGTAAPIGRFTLRAGSATGLALPFGASDADALIALARLATRYGVPEFRLAPHHALLAMDAPEDFATGAAALGFITDAADPRLHVSACIGSAGCASGFFPARALAESLAPALPANRQLHVSGCAKGCAHPRRAEVTLVGRADGYGLVIAGTAGDTPQSVLRMDDESALAAAIRQG